jgi:pyruvate carboxylase
MAMFMTSNNLTSADVLEKGEDLAFPESVKQLFRGDLGQPQGGFPKELQKLILKGEIPYTEKPNAHIPRIDFDSEIAKFREKFDENLSEEDFLSYLMYPKVFEQFYHFKAHFGNVDRLPTHSFYYPMKPNEEIIVELESGKNLIIRFKHIGEPDQDGFREVFFQINGQTRNIRIKDESIKVTTVKYPKASSKEDVGAPLQGKLVELKVKEGDSVSKGNPLFVIEAMKMETTVTATRDGVVKRIGIPLNSLVEQDDCVLEFV